MSKRAVGAVVAIAIVVALVVWMASKPKPEPAHSVTAIAVAPEPQAPSPEPPHGEKRDERASAIESPKEVASVPPTSTVADRSIRVIGRCVDRDHRPIADARVELTEISWLPKGEQHWKSIHGGMLDPKRVMPSTRSANDGTFAMPFELDDASPHGSIITVVARKEGLCRAQERPVGPPHGDFDVGELVLEPGARASGIVHDALGAPCENVHLWMFSKARTTKNGAIGDEVRSAKDGRFEFLTAPAAPCELTADADDLRRAKLDVDLSSGSQHDIDVVLPELHGRDSISGTVVDPDGRPASGAWLNEETSAGPEPHVNSSTSCDDAGRFRIDGHPDSTFVLTAVDREHRWCGVRKANIASGTHDVVLTLDGAKTFVLRVRGDADEAIDRFGYERDSDLWLMRDLHEIADHPGGDAKLPSDLAPFELRVFAPGRHSEIVPQIDPARLPSTVDVKLHRACVVRGNVRLGDRPYGARVSIEDAKLADESNAKRTEPVELPSVVTGTDGKFELTVEGEGTVRLRARCEAELSIPTDAIEIHPGKDVDGIALEFRATGSIEGAAQKLDGSPAMRLTVAATQDGKSIESTLTDEHGRYRLAGLPPGEYSLFVALEQRLMHFGAHDHARGGSPQSWRCTVEPGAATKLDLHLLDTARYRIALALPDPPQTKWLLDASIRGASEGSDFFETHLAGGESFDIELVDPFEAAILLGCDRSGWPSFVLPLQRIDRGAHEITISVATGRIEGALVAPFAADEKLALKWHGATMDVQANANIDASGRFTFECVPVGECALERSAKKGVSRVVRVESNATARVDDL